MRTCRVASVLLLMGVVGCGGTSGQAPPVAASPSPSPSANTERLSVCREALDLTATGNRLIEENIAVPVDKIDTKGIDAVTHDMSALRKKMHPVVANQFDGIRAPLLLIRIAAVNDTRATLAGQDRRGTVLLFATSCEQWAREPGP